MDNIKINKKTCPRCSVDKTIEDFSKSKTTHDSLQSACKECKRQEQINRKLTHPEKVKEITNKWYQNNKELHNERMNVCKKKNPDPYRKSQRKWRDNNLEFLREYKNKRYKNDTHFRIRSIVGAIIRQSLKRTKNEKNSLSKVYLGCTIIFYKQYLESLFLPEMNWANHGEIWEIDHIKAIANFDLSKESEQLECFNYKNTEPRFKTTSIAESFGYKDYIGNREKGDKVI